MSAVSPTRYSRSSAFHQRSAQARRAPGEIDAYKKFIEDDFLGVQRLDPATDGRPDRRPTVRENVPVLGNLVQDFDFSQPPQLPVLLPTHPAPGPASTP